MNVYGPVPSRRLGRSLGINNIPSKICSYSCVYCQAGRTTRLQVERREYFGTEQIFEEVSQCVEELRRKGEDIDYLSFVPNGEPTLDANLGKTIERLKFFEKPVAVISNASLMGRADVREELAMADWVSLKVDSVRDDLWRKMDRPFPSLRLAEILDGVLAFAGMYKGSLETETMLVRGVNDSEDSLERTGAFIAGLDPERVRLSAPVRPPAETWVEPPSEETMNMAFQLFRDRGLSVEMLVDYEGTSFSSAGEAGEDLLAITAVHPMREDAVREFLARKKSGWQAVLDLIESGRLIETKYRGNSFFLRKIHGRK